MSMEAVRKIQSVQDSEVIPLKIECRFCGNTDRKKYEVIRSADPPMVGYHCQACYYLNVPEGQLPKGKIKGVDVQ